MTKELRCIHRHTIKEHPKCFVKGLIKTKQEKKEPQAIPWYNSPGTRIGYLDIETDGLKADFYTMLSWCIKEKGGRIFSGVVTKKDLFDGKSDSRIVKELINKMKEFDILVTYYGTGFDIPFIRSKALRYKLDFPEYGEIFHFDLYYTVRNKLCLSRNSLANVCDYLDIEGKTEINKDAWRKAKYGDPIALRDVLNHNVADVVILEQLHDKIEFSRKWMRRSI